MNKLRMRAKEDRENRKRYFQSSDARTFEQKNEDVLKKRERLQREARVERRIKEERELQECTFKPQLCQRPSKGRAEREAERALKKLATEQAELREQLDTLEREARQSHDARQAIYLKRYQEVQKEEAQKVIDFLKDGEGLEYLKERAEDLVARGSVSRESAQQKIVEKLVQDAQQLIQTKVRQEMEGPQQEAEVDLKTRSLQVVLLLEGLESSVWPVLNTLHTSVAESVLAASGFVLNLASEVRKKIKIRPDTHLAASPPPPSSPPQQKQLVASPIEKAIDESPVTFACDTIQAETWDGLVASGTPPPAGHAGRRAG